MKAQILFILCFIFNVTIAKEHYQFRHLTTSDGLSDNEVIAMLKDNEGFLWCVTSSAINRFDGYNVKQYLKTEDGTNLSTSVSQILIDKDNNIWIERFGYYFTYNRERDLFVNAQPLLQKYQLHSGANLQTIITDDHNNLWSYNGETMKVYSFSTQQSHTIEDLPENITFFSVKKDKLFYIDGNNNFHITDLLHKHTNVIIPLNEVLGTEKFLSYKFYVDDNLDIWIYSSNTEGLWLFSQSTNYTWKLNTIGKNTLLLKNKVISICEDNSHKIWIGLEYDGISIYDKEKQQYTHISQNLSPYSLGSNKVWCFYYDDENTMWVGTMRNGISYYNSHFFSFSKTMLPSTYDISCQVEDREHNLWIGTDGDGIYKVDPNGNITTFKKRAKKFI